MGIIDSSQSEAPSWMDSGIKNSGSQTSINLAIVNVTIEDEMTSKTQCTNF